MAKVDTSVTWQLLHEHWFDDVKRVADHGPNLCDLDDDRLVLGVFHLVMAELLCGKGEKPPVPF